MAQKQEIADWLKSIGYENYIHVFIEEAGFDRWTILQHLTLADLKSLNKIKKGHCIKIFTRIQAKFNPLHHAGPFDSIHADMLDIVIFALKRIWFCGLSSNAVPIGNGSKKE
eukprot:UN07848